MSVVHRRWLRRRVLVDWSLQGRLCLHSLLSGAIMLVVVVGGILAPLLWQMDRSAPHEAESDELALVLLYLHDRLLPLLLLCGVLLVLGSIRMSHRIAGPLVRFKRLLRQLSVGELAPPLRTRDGDLLSEEVACLNLAIDGVRRHVQRIHDAQTSLQRELQVIRRQLPDDAIPRLDDAMQSVARATAAFTDLGDGARSGEPGAASEPPIPSVAGDAAGERSGR